jgi:hypothetical protein
VGVTYPGFGNMSTSPTIAGANTGEVSHVFTNPTASEETNQAGGSFRRLNMSKRNSNAKSNSKVRDSKTPTKDSPNGDAALRERCAAICTQFREFHKRDSETHGQEGFDEEKEEILEAGLQVAKQVIELGAMLTPSGSLDLLCEVGDLSGEEVLAIQHVKWLVRCRPLSERAGFAKSWISTEEAELAVFEACGSECEESEVENIKPEELFGQLWNPDITDLPTGLSLEALYWHVLHNTPCDGWHTPRILDELLRRKELTAEHCQEWISASGFTCSGGLDATKGFLEHRGLPVDSTLAWLKSQGIHCDLDVMTELCLGVTCFQPETHAHWCKVNATSQPDGKKS